MASKQSKSRVSAKGSSQPEGSRRSQTGAPVGEVPEEPQMQVAVTAPTPAEEAVQPSTEPAPEQQPPHDLPPLRRPPGDGDSNASARQMQPQSPTSPIVQQDALNATVASFRQMAQTVTSNLNFGNATVSGVPSNVEAVEVVGGEASGRQSERGSQAGSAAGEFARQVSVRSAATPLDGATLRRLASRVSQHTGAAPAPTPPLPAEEIIEEVGGLMQSSASQLQAEVEELRSQVARLTASNESMTRLMQSSSQDSKVRLLTEDLSKRAAAIKKLEDEVRTQKRRAEKAEKAAEESSAKDKGPKPVSSTAPVDTKELDASKKAASELKKRVESLTDSLEAERDRRLAAEQRAAAGEAMKQRLQELGQMVVQKDVQIQHLEQRLERALDAIANSAGCGFENDVKLQRTRGALINILKDGGKTAGSPSPSPARNPELGFSPRFLSGYSASPQPSTSPRRERPIYFLA